MFKKLDDLTKIVDNNKFKIAYKVNDDSITYQELWERANDLAMSLKSEGTTPVLIYGHKSIDMFISIVACLIANRTYIPIDTHIPKDRIEKIIELSKASILICNEKISVSNIKCMTVDEINEFYKGKESIDTNQNEIAYIIFTSGSTGEPKGVPISYENLENFTDWILKIIQSKEILNVMNQASFSFDLSVADIYYSLFSGSTLIALEKESQNNLSSVLDILKKENINLMVITPTFIKLLMLDNEFNEENFPNLKSIYFCGEILEVVTAKKLINRFQNLEIINAYGPTEATSAVSSVIIDEKMLENDYLPVGKINEAAVNIEIIEDEIVLKGKSVFGGYLNLISENCFLEENTNCYKTGDIGKIENNLLYCLGRKDQQIKYMGYRIELGDIESNLLKIDEIREAVVVADYKEGTSIVKSIKAFITVSCDIFVNDIKNKLKETLPEYMIPKKISILDKIPVNDNGKYDRKKLKKL